MLLFSLSPKKWWGMNVMLCQPWLLSQIIARRLCLRNFDHRLLQWLEVGWRIEPDCRKIAASNLKSPLLWSFWHQSLKTIRSASNVGSWKEHQTVAMVSSFAITGGWRLLCEKACGFCQEEDPKYRMFGTSQKLWSVRLSPGWCPSTCQNMLQVPRLAMKPRKDLCRWANVETNFT